MTTLEVWNWANITALVFGVVICLAYVFTHADGKRLIMLWAAFGLLVSLILRLSLAAGILADHEFTLAIRPWAIVTNALAPILAIASWADDRK